ncbi:Predicted N-acetyltransferase [Ceraceosorus bombacis]|uniref:Predicted N-acetyltransferase n=1 Tax=Ceraceosorus bombacis TaxID=401625 RepID=A0A0P1BKP6_9BASI|nr:Predicted N-acetyltransferase [Ceraceosorus bombacis]
MASTATTSSLSAPPPPKIYAARSKAPIRSVIPHKIALALLTPNNVGQLRRLNSVLFPVRFSDGWYKDVLHKDVAAICKLALFNDIPVGNICCRYEREGGSEVKVYIMTLGVLAPYRRLGIASELLRHLLTVAGVGTSVSLRDPNAPVPKAPSASTNSKSSNSNNANAASKSSKDSKTTSVKTEEPKRESRTVKSLYLHVQTSNDEAKAFYESHGFQHTGTVQDYYKVGIEPRSAWVLERLG